MKKFIIGFTVLCMFIMVAGISNASLTTQGCVEDDSGSIDIAGTSAVCGGNVSVPVRIQNAPDAFDSVGFEIAYDSSVLTYTGFEKEGTLAENFDQFDVSEISAGVVRCGGFRTSSEIPAGTGSDLVYLKFAVSSDCNESKLELSGLKDDIKSWAASSGCFRPADKCTGDINGDGETTPQDALCAFEKYMGVCPTSCEIECTDVCCDVNSDSDCTPADALCIFDKYLGNPGCIDDTPPAAFITIAKGTLIRSVNNDTAYELPMSVIVADSNGNPIPNAEVSLGVWPGKYGSGHWFECSSSCCFEATGVFSNEDVNRNQLLDEGEDKNKDGMLTPPKSAAGILQPSLVVTGQDGTADFSLTYLKSIVPWIEAEITAKVFVSRNDTGTDSWPGNNLVQGNGEGASPLFFTKGGNAAFTINNNSAMSNCIVTLRNKNTHEQVILLNTLSPVANEKISVYLDAGTYSIEVDAVGDWSIEAEGNVETNLSDVIQTSVNYWLGYAEEDRCSLPDSPFNDSSVSINTPPELSSIPNQMVHEDTVIEVTATVSDKEGGALNISVTSSNNDLIPNDSSHININGYGQSYVLFSSSNESVNLPIIITPAANMYGTTELTVAVIDDIGNTAARTFLLQVFPVNDPPVISAIPNKITNEDTPADVSFMLSDVEGGDITVSASSNNSYLVPNDNNHIDINGFGMEHTFTLTPGENSLPLKITPAAHQFGTAAITIKAEDGDFSVTSTFMLAVQE
ncbi:MAG: hypothetical protein GY749_36380 [Desulfobacteraceae bacterium]|nr:hypothetical protein [Desulfobacteraceae bacterium]